MDHAFSLKSLLKCHFSRRPPLNTHPSLPILDLSCFLLLYLSPDFFISLLSICYCCLLEGKDWFCLVSGQGLACSWANTDTQTPVETQDIHLIL